ncbi:MAG: ATP-dependent DNA helicase [Actinomycetota bacterium]
MIGAADLLGKVTQSLDGGGETRTGQIDMTTQVADAIDDQTTLLIEAGTGTGKSLAYLTPIIASERKAVVATATIALQNQLITHDVPQVSDGLGVDVSVALLKGRRNYLCRQRLAELERANQTEQMELLRGKNPANHLDEITEWSERTTTGDREELDPAPPPDVWSAVSVGPDECPGAARCPEGGTCFAERARLEAFEADVIVTNHHYYGLHLASGGTLLPEHDVVVFDEAHQLVDTFGATCGTELSGNRFRTLARRIRAVLTDDDVPAALDRSSFEMDDDLRPQVGKRAELGAELIARLVAGRDRAEQALNALRKLNPSEGTDVAARIQRATLAATSLVNDVDAVIEAGPDDVLWVDGSDYAPILRRTPLKVGDVLDAHLWPDRSVILTSATLADGLVPQLGLDGSNTAIERVASPFDYPELGLLYCPTDLPNPRRNDHRAAVQDEIAALATAAGGRTLALFTSYSALRDAADALEGRVPGPLLVQGDGPRDALVERLRTHPGAVLLATMSFWQGVDIPGDALTLVTIDRIPFPRPDEPVSQARRDKAGPAAFAQVDLPRAQILLAQAAGRLVRRTTDRGVVAVLDPRLATAKNYRWELIHALPPFRRTKDRSEVLAFLAALDAEATSSASRAPTTDASDEDGDEPDDEHVVEPEDES